MTDIRKAGSISLPGLLPTVIAAAEAAGERLVAEFTHPQGPRGRGGSDSPVDDEIEADLRVALLDLLPARWRGEETGTSDDGGGQFGWLVDPHDGTQSFLRGERGSAVSIALLRAGIPVLGVVHCPQPMDGPADTIAWAEGLPHVLRNGQEVWHRIYARPGTENDVVLVGRSIDDWPEGYATLLRPMTRHVMMPSIAYRLARVAAGDATAAVCLTNLYGWDYAAGHALLLGAGGELYDETGTRIVYTVDGESYAERCVGGLRIMSALLARRSWGTLNSTRPLPRRTAVSWPRGDNAPALDRAIGSLIGQVAGDSLGSQMRPDPDISIASGCSDRIPKLVDGGTWNLLAGQPTGGSELMLALARTLFRQSEWTARPVIKVYIEWLKSHPFDASPATIQALEAAVRVRAPTRAAAAKAASSLAAETSGALLRCAPIGLWARNSAEAAETARQDTALTHPNPTCVAASAALAAAIATAVNGGNTRDIMDAATAVAGEDASAAVSGILAEANEMRPPTNLNEDHRQVLTALHNAFFHLARGSTLLEALEATTNGGRAPSSTAAICGALLGAKNGCSAIPSSWRMAILSCRPTQSAGAQRPRPPAYWPDDLPMLAEALLARR